LALRGHQRIPTISSMCILRFRRVGATLAVLHWVALASSSILMAQVAGEPAPAPRSLTYRTVDGLSLEADVYRPAGGGTTPALLYLHGGALIMGMRHSIRRWQLSRYLERGYTVVVIDYRLAPETKLPGILDDVRQAYAWMRSESGTLGIDPRRIGVVGHSAGGYLALMCGEMLAPPPAAIVAFYGYGDILGRWCTEPDSGFLAQPRVTKAEADSVIGTMPISEASGSARGRLYTYMRQQGSWPRTVTGMDPVTQATTLRRYSPALQVTHHYPATMLLHGSSDTDVPYQQSVEMRDALARAHAHCELVTLTGKDHGFDFDVQDPEVQAAFDRVLAFLDGHLRPHAR